MNTLTFTDNLNENFLNIVKHYDSELLNKNGLLVILINIRSLNKNYDGLNILLDSLKRKPDIIILYYIIIKLLLYVPKAGIRIILLFLILMDIIFTIITVN